MPKMFTEFLMKDINKWKKKIKETDAVSKLILRSNAYGMPV